jgi:hypothetical protein
MKPIDRIQPLRARLRTLALASALGAAAFFGSGPQARADLIGHWFSGAENLSETSGFTAPGTHDGVAVGNVGSLSYSTDLPPGFTEPSLRSLSLTNNVAVQVSNSATTD